jgi:hypothetical protein
MRQTRDTKARTHRDTHTHTHKTARSGQLEIGDIICEIDSETVTEVRFSRVICPNNIR